MASIQVDTITNTAGTGAPNFPFGLTSGSSIPTTQKFLTGSGTYTPAAGVKYVRVKMVGGGGGGAGSSTQVAANGGSAGNGGNSTFGTLTAGGGVGAGGGLTTGGAGGNFTIGAGFTDVNSSTGNYGGASALVPSNTTSIPAGFGGTSIRGGGAAQVTGNNSGVSATANSGSGGSGAGAGNGVGTYIYGSGGGSSSYVDAVGLATSVSYSVAAGGTLGALGTGGNNGGPGGTGIITVEEFYF